MMSDGSHRRSRDDTAETNELQPDDTIDDGDVSSPLIGTATRRGILAATALLGGAGAASARSTQPAGDGRADGSGDPETSYQDPSGLTESVDVADPTTTAVVQVPGDYASIQKAIDNLPANGGTILVDEARYSSGDDSLPIRMTDRPANIVGTTRGDRLSDGLDFTSNTTDPVFVIDITRQWRINVRFLNLHVQGGKDIVRLKSGTFFQTENCWFEEAARDAVHHEPSGEALYLSLNNTLIEHCGQDGVNLSNYETTSRPNAMVLNHVISRENGRHGAWLCGAGCRTVAGAYERNGGAGIKVGANDGKTTAAIFGPYFEGNGSESSGTIDDADLHAQPGGDKTVTVVGAHQSASDSSAEGIYLRTGRGHWVAGTTSLTGGANLRIGSGTRDAKVWTTDPMDVTIDDDATRPCVNGLYRDSGNATTPGSDKYQVGEAVEWTDRDNHEGDGIYRLGYDGSTWYRMQKA